MTDATGTTSYMYDPFTGQLNELTYPDGLTLTINEYDANGNRLRVTDPFGGVIHYSYDEMNRIHTVGTDELNPDANYTYKNGMLTQNIFGNGMISAYQYSGLHLSWLTQSSNGEVTNDFQFEYDGNKNMKTRTQNGVTDTFTYDELNRIATASPSEEAYTYDQRGNRQTLDTLQVPEIQDETNVYNNENQLVHVTIGDNEVDYQYNGDGLLVERSEDGDTTRYYYDGDQIIAAATIVGGIPQLKARFIRGNQLEAIQYADGSKAYALSNGHGDIVELRDESGELLNNYDYDIWGNPTEVQEQVYNPFRYSGELWDDSTHLQYLRARWYDPSIGRFITEDTYEGQIGNPLTLNLYTYAGNNSLIYYDPTGHSFLSDSWDGFVEGSKVLGNQMLYDLTHVGQRAREVADFLVVDDVRTILDPNSSAFDKGLALAGFVPIGKVVKGEKLIVKLIDEEGKIIERSVDATQDSLNAAKALKYDTQTIASDLSAELGGKVSAASGDGWKITGIANPLAKKQPIMIRIMNEGSGGRANSYFRISVGNYGALNSEGKISSDMLTTHFDLIDDYMNQIQQIISKYLNS